MKNNKLNPFKALFLAVLFISFFSCKNTQADTGKPGLIEAFLRDAIDLNIPGESLIQKYMCIDTSANKNKEIREFLDLQLYRLRMMMLGQSKKITNDLKNSIISYKSLPRSQQTLLIEAGDEENVFSFRGEQGVTFLILIRGKKIASFTTMNKGGKKVFIIMCG